MSGIIIDVNPVALEIGGFTLSWYSVAIVLGITAAVLITLYLAKKKGINSGEIQFMALWVVIGGVVGARLFHLIDHWEYYLNNPQQILGFQGLAIWGALIGGGLALVLYARVRHLPLGRLVDAVAPGLLAAQIIGRFGCIVNGDAYGAATGLPWGFIYTHPSALIPPHLFGIPTHPYPVYEMLWNVIALILLYRFRGYFRNDGLLFLTYLAHYSLVRFVLTFVREENIIVGGLQQAQIVAIFGFIISIALFVYLKIKARHKEIAAFGV